MAEGKKEIQVVLLDIEGTTTSISFVAEILFPYVRKRLKEYLKNTWETQQTIEDVAALRELATQLSFSPPIPIQQPQQPPDQTLEAVVKFVVSLMDEDKKVTALKALQGHIWKDGYEKGELIAMTYDDVLPALQEWKHHRVPVYIYSSGSVQAQKLLFSNTRNGNVLDLFSGHFDTTIGLKVEKQSYINILDQLQILRTESSKVLFVTDSPLEAAAAIEVGISVLLADRPGNNPIPPEASHFPVIKSFDEIFSDRFTFSFTPKK